MNNWLIFINGSVRSIKRKMMTSAGQVRGLGSEPSLWVLEGIENSVRLMRR
jgi:hypothetical protein